jgi:hypothetical protein
MKCMNCDSKPPLIIKIKNVSEFLRLDFDYYTCLKCGCISCEEGWEI